MNADDEVKRLAELLGAPPPPDPLQLALAAANALDELGILDKQIAATKARLLALADAAQRIHDAHDGTSSVCPLADDLRRAAALL